MKQKTILEWLNELPELIREEAIAQYHDTVFKRIYPVSNRMSCAIHGAFFWDRSILGRHFWYAMYKDALYHEQHNLKLPR